MQFRSLRENIKKNSRSKKIETSTQFTFNMASLSGVVPFIKSHPPPNIPEETTAAKIYLLIAILVWIFGTSFPV